MMVFVQGILFAIVFVTTVQYNLAATKEQGRGVWKPDEKMNLMRIWNRIYKGNSSGNYVQTLRQEWLQIYPDGKGKSVSSLTNMVDRLLKEKFVIPPENPSQNAIRLSVDVKQKRDSGFYNYVEILPPNYKGHSQHTPHQSVGGSSSHTDSETDSRVGKEAGTPSPPWERIDEINLMKAIVNVQKFKKYKNYKQRLFDEFEKTDPNPTRRNFESVIDKATELKREGFVIPADFNNGDMTFPLEEINFNPISRQKNPPWSAKEELILMKALHSVQEYKGSTYYQEKVLEEWHRLHRKPSKRNSNAVWHRTRELNKKGFVIPAEYNNGEEINVEPDEEQHKVRWNTMENINLMKACHSVRQYRDSKNYQQMLLKEWDQLHSIPSEKTPESVLTRARKLNKRGFIIPAQYNDGKKITVKPDQEQHTAEWDTMEEVILMKACHKARKYYGQSGYKDKLLKKWNELHSTPSEKPSETVLTKADKICRSGFVIPAHSNNGDEIIYEPLTHDPKGKKYKEKVDHKKRKSWNRGSGSSNTHDIQPPQSSSQTNVPSPYADLFTEDYEHESVYHPQFDQFYHGFNEALHEGSATPRPGPGVHSPVYQSNITQHHYGTSSSSSTHHGQSSQTHSQTNIPFPYPGLSTEHYEHGSEYHPQFEHSYHGFNDTLHVESATPWTRRETHSPAYQSDIAQHHSGTSSSTHYHPSHPQTSPRVRTPPSTSHSVPQYLYDMPISSPSHYHSESDD